MIQDTLQFDRQIILFKLYKINSQKCGIIWNMFDTHCHLNFKAFKKTLPDIIQHAKLSGLTNIVIPGTDVKTSKVGVSIAQEYDWIYAAVGIHPHHVYKLLKRDDITIESELDLLESLISEEKVVAVGEIGMDKHVYEETVYEEYNVNGEFIKLQKELFRKQLQLAIKYNKSLILHNREAKEDLLPIVEELWDEKLKGRTVLHCCETLEELLEFAKSRHIYIGVDGDITFIEEKQKFITKVPDELLVLETDSPFLLPEPLRTQKKYPNNPSNIHIVAETVAKLRKVEVSELIRQTSENARRLFNLD